LTKKRETRQEEWKGGLKEEVRLHFDMTGNYKGLTETTYTVYMVGRKKRRKAPSESYIGISFGIPSDLKCVQETPLLFHYFLSL